MTQVISVFSAIIASGSIGAGAALAQHAGDIHLEVFGDAIVTSTIEDIVDPDTFELLSEAITHDTRVYGSEMGKVQPGWTDEPGFDSFTDTFPPGSEVGFNIVGPALEWEAGEFVPTSHTLSVSFATLSVESGAGFVPGFSLPVSDSGEWHRHLEFELSDPDAVGVYLLPLELWSDDAAIENSLPFYIVFNNGDDEAAHDLAIEYTKREFTPGLKLSEIQLAAGRPGRVVVEGAASGQRIHLAYALSASPEAGAGIPGCPGLRSVLVNPAVVGAATADARGVAAWSLRVPGAALGRAAHVQAATLTTCGISNWATIEFLN